MKNSDSKILVAFCSISLIVIFSGCAHNTIVKECLTGQPYGFWGGIWHGIIAPFDFLGMIFGDNITMYAQNNNGVWYALGFLIGSGGWGFLGGGIFKKSKRD